jgi:hypothetical protein
MHDARHIQQERGTRPVYTAKAQQCQFSTDSNSWKRKATRRRDVYALLLLARPDAAHEQHLCVWSDKSVRTVDLVIGLRLVVLRSCLAVQMRFHFHMLLSS